MVSDILCERGAETSLSDPWVWFISWRSHTKTLFCVETQSWFSVVKHSIHHKYGKVLLLSNLHVIGSHSVSLYFFSANRFLSVLSGLLFLQLSHNSKWMCISIAYLWNVPFAYKIFNTIINQSINGKSAALLYRFFFKYLGVFWQIVY